MKRTSKLTIMRGKRVTVMGLGLHGGGVSAVRWLLKHGAIVIVTDLRTARELRPSLRQFQSQISNLKFVFGRHRAENFVTAEMVVRNPAVPNNSSFLQHARKKGIPIENEATLFFKYCRSRNIIGITGTRGKSTTATMIYTILRRKLKTQNSKLKTRVWLAGNIRTTPMLSIVDRVKPNDWVVLELSSWHLETMDEQELSPHIAVVTNLLPDHLNRYTSMRAYARAKETIVRYQRRNDIAVLNKENPWTRRMAKRTKARVFLFQHHRGRSSVVQRTVPRMLGEHNHRNAEAAATAVRAVGIPYSIIRRVLKNFPGISGRLERIRTVRGVTFYNDTTATTPDATIAALRAFTSPPSQGGARGGYVRRIILIAGGSDKNLSYAKLAPVIKKTCRAVVLLPGTATEKIVRQLKTHPPAGGSKLITREASSMPSAVRKAWKLVQRGDIILLSPAAASFGLFKHEFDRGDQFVRAVQKITLLGRK